MNLKDILTDVLEYIGEEPSSSYASNSDIEFKRLVTMANSSVADILKIHNWGLLKKSYSFSIVNGTQLYDLPDDYNRFISDTSFTNNYEVDMPTSDAVIAYNNLHGSNYEYQGRLIGGQVEFLNIPEGELTIYYVSNTPISSKSGLKTRFTSDTDEYLLDDELLIRAIRQRYQNQVGEDTQVSMSDFNNRLKQLIGDDVGARSFYVNSDRNSNYFPFKRK